MTIPDYDLLVKQLVDENPSVRDMARRTLLQLDEDAVDPLLDQFYAGVTDAQGIAILGVVAAIGGPDAMSALRNVFHFEETRLRWKQTAAKGLLYNRDSLSPNERIEVETYVHNLPDDV